MLLLTLNMDDNPGLAEAYVREHKLTFPVLPALAYTTGSLAVNGIPENWIVDAGGVVRLKQIGYTRNDKWEGQMADAIEKFRPGAVAAGAPPSQAP